MRGEDERGGEEAYLRPRGGLRVPFKVLRRIRIEFVNDRCTHH